jgi:MoaA/NifB/PqqE/SkfB family radical SAM enzyme
MRFLKTYFKYVNEFLMKKPFEITELNFAITYKCNSCCKMCKIWEIYKKNPQLEKEELNLSQIKNAFRNLTHNLRNIVITGGEPFLRDDLKDIILYFQEKFAKAKITIITNGLLKNKILDFATAHRDIHYMISIDGYDKKSYKRQRGIDKFDEVVETFKRLRSIGVNVGVSSTITSSNYHDFWRIVNFLKTIGDGVLCLESSSDIYYHNKKIKLDKNIAYFFNSISKMRLRMGDYVNWFFYGKVVDYIKNNRMILPCYALQRSIFIDPYGNVFPCIFMDDIIGNLKWNNLQDVLSYKKRFEIIRKIREEKCPNCWTQCQSLLNIKENLHVLPLECLKLLCRQILNF